MSLPTLESTGQVTLFTAGESETIAAFANVSGGTVQSGAKSCNQLSRVGDNAQRQQKGRSDVDFLLINLYPR